jgi:oxygen-independent coproporphyrinogen-3 oxidase
MVEDMMNAIENEIILRKNYTGEKFDTIYFGGGTPSFIDTRHVSRLMDVIRNNFEIDADPEITLEANPDDLSVEKCEALFAAGINRLSIGIQSFIESDLVFMNRAHNAKQALESVRNAKAAGFNNISIDLIYGTRQSQSAEMMDLWKRNLQIAFDLDVEHLSCYSLTVEKRTALADMIRKNKVQAPSDEEAVSEFEKLIELSKSAGFEHYEISNFARNKKYSRHNTSYWNGKKYLGIGPSAHSYNGDYRQWNISNNSVYIQSLGKNEIPAEVEKLTKWDKFNEYILTTLRTMWGTDLDFVEQKFGEHISGILENKIIEFIRDKYLVLNDRKIILTNSGKLFADKISSDLMQLKDS